MERGHRDGEADRAEREVAVDPRRQPGRGEHRQHAGDDGGDRRGDGPGGGRHAAGAKAAA
jgi:hypothetical protein